MSSPRKSLLAAYVVCLSRIKRVDGYLTDAGNFVTLEPGQVPEDQAAVIAVVIGRQSRPTDPAIRNTHRATDVAVVAKVPADVEATQERLDDIVSDIEKAMASTRDRFPVGTRWPEYVDMQPIPPEPGAGWTGAVVRYVSNIPIK